MIHGVSLFANVWIAEFYLRDFSVDIVVANELLPKRCDLYSYWYPESEMICGDFTDPPIYNLVLTESRKQNCELVIATPPCQGMSVAGKMREDDPRNSLILQAVRFIQDLHPKYALIENVPTFFDTIIISHGDRMTIREYLIRELSDHYDLNMWVLDTADHGTAQTRKRAITLITRKGIWKWEFPEKQKKITVREAIEWLPSLESGASSDIPYHTAREHNPRHIECMRHTPSGKTAFENEVYFPKKENGERIRGFSTTYKRIEWEKPAPTITMCNGAISSQNNVHPGRLLPDGTHSDARVLSLKEISILTGLPDDITFPSWASENFIRQVIGEGIPPKMIRELIKTFPKI